MGEMGLLKGRPLPWDRGRVQAVKARKEMSEGKGKIVDALRLTASRTAAQQHSSTAHSPGTVTKVRQGLVGIVKCRP